VCVGEHVAIDTSDAAGSTTLMHAKPTSIIPLLEAMKPFHASDLHLKPGVPPNYRVAGDLRNSQVPAMSLDEDEIAELMRPIMTDQKWEQFEARGASDFAHYLPDGDRFRINVMRAGGRMHAAIRRVRAEIPSFTELHLPPIYYKLADETIEGLVLVVGVTGCGKSSTMAAMIDHINATQHVNIISIEDPIEYAFVPKKAIVSQRELGLDLDSFSDGLRSAVRQDPDVIFVGEMRDRDTVLAALQAAETGHLVFGTLHTADTMQTMTRILEFFPLEQHDFIRSSMANSLKAVLAQRLLPSIDEQISRVPACEVLIVDAVVREKVREGEDADIPEIIAGSREAGMRNFTHSLVELIEQGLVYTDVAMEYAPNREALKGQMRGIKTSAQSLVHRVKK
jgi:twitching motility protein PilT